MRRIMAQLSTPEGQRVSSLWVSRRPASADRTTCRQLQATGQPVCRTQASDAVTSQLPRYEAKCVQRRFFQCGSVPAFRYHGNGATPSQYTFTSAENIYAEVDDYRQVFVVLISLLCKILMHAKNWIHGIVDYTFPVSYTHLTLPTIYSV